MSVPNRYLLEHGSTLSAIGRVALLSLEQQLLKKMPKGAPPVPGPTLEATYPARSADLVRDYIKHVGGDPAAYKNTLPPHMFPQWGFGLGGRALDGVPYPISKVLNGGCNLEIKAPIPANEPITVTARLESIDDDGRRAVMQQRVITSTRSVKEALIADMFAIVPLKRPKGENGGGEKKEKKEKDTPRVPDNAKELAYWEIGAKAGLDFAKLTGDFNPIHWIPPAAKASGFPNVILHGFGTMARAIEGVNRGVFSGDVTRMKKWNCRFTKPLVLPGKAGLYVKGNEVFVGVAPGGPAFLVGSFEG
jgi:acyl dehydratase